jgi:colanic acid biosynthesis glycosyl transferase WcaI
MPESRLATQRLPAAVDEQNRRGRSGTRAVKVAYVTQWFSPEPSNIPVWIATSLRRRGLEVDVLTGVPNYPTGRIYPGYSAWRRSHETIDGFDVTRTPTYPSHGQSSVGRIANLASYAVSSALLGKSSLMSADVTLVYSSPATAAVAAMRARKRWGIPYVLLILDVWPDSVFASGFLTGGPVRRLAEKTLGWFTNKAYEGASHVAVTSPGMRDLLLSRGVSAEKISIVYNWTDEQTMKPANADNILRTKFGLSDSFLLMYAGNHGAAQKLDTAMNAMAQLADLPDVHLLMVGNGSAKRELQELAAKLELSNVHFADQVEPGRVPGLMASADMQLVSLADQDLFRITMPSKVQSIMACAQPILLSAAGDAAAAVEQAGAGITCPPENPRELAAAIRRARAIPKRDLSVMGSSGYEYYRSRMSEAVNSRVLARALKNAAGVADQQ